MTMVDRPQMQPSLKAYLTSGRTSALRALDLSHISHYFPGWKDWIKLGRKLPLLDSFTYAPRSMASMDEAKDMLKAFRHVRRLHFVDPSQGGFDEEEDLEEIEFSSEFVTLLSKFLSLERLVLNVWVPNYLLNDDEHDPEGIGWAAVEELVETCEELESVQLRYFWEGIGCEDEPVIVEYAVKTTGEGFTLEVTEPKILEGTILDFLDWR
ncbi:hypothetical protein C8R44DRAFT_782886 [Mycena epipterygia]|nr:hypothetical protein C8R44DRAFT_782886 [Mycena epipterygia]